MRALGAFPPTHTQSLGMIGTPWVNTLVEKADLVILLATPNKKIVCFSGDGSIFMNIQERITMTENNLNITILASNNQSPELVKPQLFFNKNFKATQFEATPAFLMLAKAFGIKELVLLKQRILLWS